MNIAIFAHIEALKWHKPMTAIPTCKYVIVSDTIGNNLFTQVYTVLARIVLTGFA